MRPRIMYLLLPDEVSVYRAYDFDTNVMKAYLSKKKAARIQYYFWQVKDINLTILKVRLDHVGYRVKKIKKKIGVKSELKRTI